MDSEAAGYAGQLLRDRGSQLADVQAERFWLCL